MKKFLCTTLALGILSTSTMANSYNYPSSVIDPSSEIIMAEQWMLDAKISNGISPNNFGGKEILYANQAQTLINNFFEADQIYFSQSPIKIDDMCKMIVSIFDESYFYSFLKYDENIIKVFKNCNLLPPKIKGDRLARREDLAQILYRIHCNNYNLNNYSFKISVEEGIFRHPLEIMPYLLELQKLPENLLSCFTGELRIGLEEEKYWEKYFGYKISGIYDSRDKSIYVTNPQSLKHEFGHFMEDYLHNFYKHNEIYKEYGETLSKVFSNSYCLTDSQEFFAEVFRFYLSYPERLKENIPEIFSLIENELKNLN